MAETDVVVVLSDEEEGEGGEVVDADGAPILSKLKKRNISVVKSKTVQIGGGGGGGGGATMVGLHRNPSGQSTLAFDRRIKNSAKRRGPQEEHDPDKVDKKMAKLSPAGPSILQHLIPSRVSVTSSSSSSSSPAGPSSSSSRAKSSSRSRQEDKLKISISQGKTTEIEILLKNRADKGSRNGGSSSNNSKGKTARKSVVSFTPSVGPEEVLAKAKEEEPKAGGETEDSPEVICISSDEDAPLPPPPPSKGEKEKLPKTNGHHSKVKEEEEEELEEKRGFFCVEEAVSSLLDCCRCILPSGEFAQVQKRLDKKLSSLNEWDLASEKLARYVDKRRAAIHADHESLYLHIKMLLDEFRSCQKKTGNATPTPPPDDLVKAEKEDCKEGSSSAVAGTSNTAAEEKEVDKSVASSSSIKPASAAHIKKLERALRDCREAIMRLETQECDWDEEEDSAYLKADRYQRKLAKIYAKLAELKGCDRSLGRRSDKKGFRFEGSRHREVNAKIEKFVRRRRAEGKEAMPDFADVLGLVKAANSEEGSLRMTKDDVFQEAKLTFQAVCQKLRVQRVHDTDENLESFLEVPVREGESFKADPAEGNPEMEQKLQESRAAKVAKEQKLFDEFARKQVEDGAEPEEVPDNDKEEEEERPEEEDDKLTLSSLDNTKSPDETAEENGDDDVEAADEVGLPGEDVSSSSSSDDDIDDDFNEEGEANI